MVCPWNTFFYYKKKKRFILRIFLLIKRLLNITIVANSRIKLHNFAISFFHLISISFTLCDLVSSIEIRPLTVFPVYPYGHGQLAIVYIILKSHSPISDNFTNTLNIFAYQTIFANHKTVVTHQRIFFLNSTRITINNFQFSFTCKIMHTLQFTWSEERYIKQFKFIKKFLLAIISMLIEFTL